MTDSAATDEAPSIWIGRGPRALEALLLARVAALAAAARANPSLLSDPVRIVVPSRSLADHVGERLVRAGRACAGVQVQTLFALALEILERTGAAPPALDALFPVLVRRLAAEEPLLRERLAELSDGYAAVEASVSDLLDAGLDADCADAVCEAIASADLYPAARERALAVARVAARCFDAMQKAGGGHRALLLRAAREALCEGPDRALPARAVFVHGFADVTGLRADLIEELVRRRGASVLIDEPPDPARPEQADTGRRFTDRLRERLSFLGERPADVSPLPEPEIRCFDAARPDGEVREAAARVREALDAGELPERIGVVARDLAGYRAALRRHFGRLGIPFSGAGEGGVGPRMRHLRALEALLRDHEECRVERWLDAMAPTGRAVHESDLRLGLRRLGLVRLHELAGHAPRGEDVKLPVVAGWWQGDDAESGESLRAVRRRLHADALARAVGAARSACARLSRLRAGGPCEQQLGELSALLREDLGWDLREPQWEGVHAELETLRGALPADFPLGPDDLALLVRRRLAPLFLARLGGEGGGVQVLDATAARGRCFDRLFLIGLSRDAFPRSPREDPLLPDGLRERVRELLAEIPIKKLGFDEERFLFAELLASAPHVAVSWPLASEDGRPCARSGFVERLRWGGRFEEPEHARPVLALAGGAGLPRLAVEEHLLRAALPGPRGRLAAVLPAALRWSAGEILAGKPASQVEALAHARVAVLREVELGGYRAAPLGPYFGFVGAQRASLDPRAAPLHVTTLERLAACGWQTLLSRLLRMEAPPDAGGALPGIDKRLLGSAVHRAIERVFAMPGAGWPGDAELAALAAEAAASVLEDEGVPLRGLARVLAQRALPFLVRARSLDRAEAEPLEILAAEGERSIQVEDADGRPRELRFRADRIERVAGRERLTDFKTGKPISDGKLDTRRKHFLARIASGRALQPLAYARSTPDGGEGRLLFLGPDVPDGAAEYPAKRSDTELGAAFDSALRGLFEAWDAGTFFPRLLEKDLEKEPRTCLYCEVATACLRGDTGARRRLAGWLEAREPGEGARAAGAERALFNLFRLGEDGGEKEEG